MTTEASNANSENQTTAKTTELAECKTIPFEQFKQIELRVAKIEEVEEVPNSNKLYKLKISLGDKEPARQLISGIKKYYTIEQLVGKKIIIVANLAPAKIMGLESQGMILAADDSASGAVSLLQCDQDLPAGSCIR